MAPLMRHLHRIALVALWLSALALAPSAHAARVALVIGNASYEDRPLKNPANDAQDLATALTAAGFKVTLKKNLSADGMKEAISEFGDALRRENDTGLFYFSGHGVQTPKGNYLLPVGRAFKREKDVELFAVEARSVLSEMQQAKNPLNILILDACRDSPLPSADKSMGSKGLARMDAPSGSVIAFATAPGKTASDNAAGRNGLYTKHLIAAINTPGLRLEDVFKRVGAAVEKESAQQGGDQSPEEVMKLRSEHPFYFKGGAGVQTASLSPEPTGRPVQSDPEEDAWQAAKSANTAAAFEAYLGEYPKGRYASAARIAKVAVQGQATAQAAPAQTAPQRTAADGAAVAAGQVIKDCTDCPEMLVIPAGIFELGGSEQRERPLHSVSIKSFAMGKTPVTQGLWQAVMGSNPSHFQQCGANCPVERVSWDDAQAFIQKLKAKTGKQYRLPSEAEWEYACRAGGRHEYCGSDNADAVGWYSANSGFTTHPVAVKQANGFGLYDMSGNVWQWVEDYHHDSYSGAPIDGSVWTTGGDQEYRVLRGGSWYGVSAYLGSAFRFRNYTSNRNYDFGFRLARTLFTH
jgi:formylglycine-generating enzyme required for sulfatase activity